MRKRTIFQIKLIFCKNKLVDTFQTKNVKLQNDLQKQIETFEILQAMLISKETFDNSKFTEIKDLATSWEENMNKV